MNIAYDWLDLCSSKIERPIRFSKVICTKSFQTFKKETFVKCNGKNTQCMLLMPYLKMASTHYGLPIPPCPIEMIYFVPEFEKTNKQEWSSVDDVGKSILKLERPIWNHEKSDKSYMKGDCSYIPSRKFRSVPSVCSTAHSPVVTKE